jgi:hypothetical protein
VDSPEPTPPARKPLLVVALGLLVVQLRAELNGVDALPDPLGWLIIAFASRELPGDVPRRGAIIGSAVLAAVVSVGLWPTAWNDEVRDLDESLLWAITLPGLAWSILFCLAIGYLAARVELVSSLLWRYLVIAFAVTAILPVIVFGGEADWLQSTYATISALAQLSLFVLCLLHAWRPWATFEPEPK